MKCDEINQSINARIYQKLQDTGDLGLINYKCTKLRLRMSKLNLKDRRSKEISLNLEKIQQIPPKNVLRSFFRIYLCNMHRISIIIKRYPCIGSLSRPIYLCKFYSCDGVTRVSSGCAISS